ncbi:MAG TPA: polysaccharide deacetylase family protein, partial [Thermodesulfobacteriota bacterium]|nr:polysaccharide deacetylase family protein [Thermodesulfobacteriota bacterium]
PFDKPIYVLLYHPWLDGFESYFIHHLSWLKDHRFETISPQDLHRYVTGENLSLPDRPIVITFDDGSIENYTVAYPLLKQYGYSGTVFAPTADEYIQRSGTEWWKEVEAQGILRIEGHSHTHALAFINAQVEDFYTGKNQDQEPIIKGLDERYGAPIFGLGYELVSRIFIPRREFTEKCVEYVNRQGGVNFFQKENWKEEMFFLISEYKEDRGRYETEEEKGERIGGELELSKTIIERVIGNGKEVRFFAYPFGAYDSGIMDSLKHLGYKGAFTTDPGGNLKGDNPYLLKRMMILARDSFGGLEKILEEYL